MILTTERCSSLALCSKICNRRRISTCLIPQMLTQSLQYPSLDFVCYIDVVSRFCLMSKALTTCTRLQRFPDPMFRSLQALVLTFQRPTLSIRISPLVVEEFCIKSAVFLSLEHFLNFLSDRSIALKHNTENAIHVQSSDPETRCFSR